MIAINHSKFERLIIDYNHAFNNKFSMAGGLTLGMSSDKQPNEVLFWTSFVRIARSSGFKNKDVNLRFGFTCKLRSSAFSLGANLVVGYRNQLVYQYNSYRDFDSQTNEWRIWATSNPEEKEYAFPFANSDLTRVKSHYFRTGFQPNINATIPMFERLYLNIFVGGYAGILSQVGQKVESDPLNEFTEPNPYYNT